MKTLNINQLAAVSGGANLYAVQEISTDGISDKCVAAFIETINNGFSKKCITKLTNSCNGYEADLMEARLENTLPTQIIYK